VITIGRIPSIGVIERLFSLRECYFHRVDVSPRSSMRPLHHVGYWVDDLQTAVVRAVRTLGVGPFLVHPHVTFDSFTLADGTQVRDAAYFDHSAAFASWGDLVLELSEIHSIDPALATSYRTDGPGEPGPGHVSWVVDDLEAESARLEAEGCPLIHTATSGAVQVAWHHGGPLFPQPIELHRAGPPILGMHARLAALADGWDGSQPLRPMAPAPVTPARKEP
jgi:catechol 2,3-dioxygenase-like lactoylglutathione lyase family enzyme